MTSQTGPQIITKHKLLSNLRSKDNRTMKFGELIEYNMRNIFLENSYSNFGGEAGPRSFYQKFKLSISAD